MCEPLFARTVPDTCVIFDIDGTLVDSTALDDELYRTAVRHVLGDVRIRPVWTDYDHITDAGLLRDICNDNALDAHRVALQVRTHFGELLSNHLSAHGPCVAIPGAMDVWKRLRVDRRVAVGVATGGWGHTARLKLASAGFDLEGVVLSSSDDSPVRAGIMGQCRSMLPRTETTLYIGDGEWDLAAATALGWHFLGIGERLRGRCLQWVPDFTASEVLSELL